MVETPSGKAPVNAISVPAPPAAERMVRGGGRRVLRVALCLGTLPEKSAAPTLVCVSIRWEGINSLSEGCAQRVKQTKYRVINKGRLDAAWISLLFLFSLGRNTSDESKESATPAHARRTNFCSPNLLQLSGLLRQNLQLPF